MKRFIALLMACFSLVLSSVSAQEAVTCPGALPSRLVVGQTGAVTPGSSNNIRAEPSRAATKVGEIPGGGQFTILDGPTCADDLAWWEVQYGSVTGWTVEGTADEYWLEPVDSMVAAPCISYLEVGGQGESVWYSENPIYEQPGGYPSNEVGAVPEGAIFDVVGGPDCTGGNVWVEVVYEGTRGWLEEIAYDLCDMYCMGTSQDILARRPLLPLEVVEPPPGVNPLLPSTPLTVAPDAITIANAPEMTALKSLGDGYIRGFSWSQDESHIAVAGSADVCIYAVRRLNTPPLILSGFAGVVINAKYSPDGRFLAVSDASGVLSLWDAATYEPVARLEDTDNILSMAFSSDGGQLAIARKDTGTQVWDIRDAASPTLLRQFDGTGYKMQFIGESSRIVRIDGLGEGVTILDAATGDTLNLTADMGLDSFSRSIDKSAISPDGKYVSIIVHEMIGDTSMAHFYYLFGWNIESAEPRMIQNEEITRSGFGTIAYNATGPTFLLGTDDEIRLSDPSINAFGLIPLSNVTVAAFSPNSLLAALGTSAGAIHLYAGRQFVDVLYGINGAVQQVAFSPNGTYVAAKGDDNTVRVWEVASRRRLGTIRFVIAGNSFVVAPDGTSIYTDKGTWNIATGTQDTSTAIPIYSWYIMRDDGLLAHTDYSADFSKVLVVSNPATGEILREIPYQYDSFSNSGITFSQDGRLAAYASTQYARPSVRVVDLESGAMIREFVLYFDYPIGILISPDNRLLAVFDRHSDESSSTLLIWEIASGDLLANEMLSDTYSIDLVYSPDGAKIAWTEYDPSDSNNRPPQMLLHIFDLADRTETIYTLPFASRSNIVFSTDGSFLTLGDNQGNIHLWDSATGEEVTLLKGHIGEIARLAFNPDGTRLYSGSSDGLIYIWGIAEAE